MTEIVEPRETQIQGLPVRRVLPSRKRRSVGPFVFLDEMGPVEFEPGEGIGVPPHPHIGLSTLTYLFDGTIVHRDSLGVLQPIRPGAVNWMTAGHGVTHSERADEEERARRSGLHGVQAWVALPPEAEDVDPSFEHRRADELPVAAVDGVSCVVLAGEAFGERSPVRTFSPLFYVDARWSSEGGLVLAAELGERALYPIDGEVEVGGELHAPGRLVVLDDGRDVGVRGEAGARALLLGGAPRGAP
ncbi:MAG: pirin family protein, partial [Myxococcota bacterium]